ncbi:MAG: patatin-like phospholipase family protein [Alphaproteobacteria bacterium]|nr:MAG: patatin-like phospholipase family protein [Alphaproteobacteria bacterium]
MISFWRKRRLNLALEGGGAHGAFTWGVLDRLLEEETIEVGWISGTSAGAVNAVAVAGGLVEGGRAGARAKLRAVWEAVAKAGVPDLLRNNPWLAGISKSNAVAQMASLFSPYDFNPLNFDPFRKLLEAHVDFAQLRASSGPELLIAATDVANGLPRLFRRREMTVECVLASACLPTIHHAVTIDGHAYWDGGFSANPDLVTLGRESPFGDTLIVKLNGIDKPGVPMTAREITARINQITFNQPMLRDMQLIETVRAHHRRWSGPANAGDARLARQRFHVIDAGRFTSSLPPESKGKPDLDLLLYLHGVGRSETEKWLARSRSSVGRRSTVDFAKDLLSGRPGAAAPQSATRSTPGAAA